MGKRSPRNNSSLASPIASSAFTVAFCVTSSSTIDAVPICKRNDWGMLKKSTLDGGLSEGFWLAAVIANSLVVEKSVKRSQNSGVRIQKDFTHQEKEFKLDKICYWFSLQGALAQSEAFRL